MKKKRTSYKRHANGSILILVSLLAFFLLLPMGLAAFDLERLHLAQQQLKSACDSGVLAASIVFCGDSTKSMQKSSETGLRYFRMNNAGGVRLEDATISDVSDSLPPGQSTFALTYDKKSRQLIASACVGLTPVFGRFIGVKSVTLNAVSKAKSTIPKDIIVIFDSSSSMAPVIGQAKDATIGFVEGLHNEDFVHFGLVNFNNEAKTLINLSCSDNEADQTQQAIATLGGGGMTNTCAALQESYKAITGPGKRPNTEKIVVLISDGVPTVGGGVPECENAAAQLGKAGVRLVCVGFYHDFVPQYKVIGPQMMTALASAAGSNSQVYNANDPEELRDVLAEIANVETSLNN